MPANEGRIRNDLAVINDVGQFSLRCLVEAGGVDGVRKTGHLQQYFRLGHERARVGKTECRSKAFKRYHLPASLRDCTVPRPASHNIMTGVAAAFRRSGILRCLSAVELRGILEAPSVARSAPAPTRRW